MCAARAAARGSASGGPSGVPSPRSNEDRLMLSEKSLPDLQRALADEELDGWLVFDFHGVNPIAGGLLGLEGLVTRRIFAYIPRDGVPVAITHAIEQGPWHR